MLMLADWITPFWYLCRPYYHSIKPNNSWLARQVSVTPGTPSGGAAHRYVHISIIRLSIVCVDQRIRSSRSLRRKWASGSNGERRHVISGYVER